MKTTIIIFLFSLNLLAAAYFVDPSGQPRSNHFTTIEAAVAAATEAGEPSIILLKPGSYASSTPLVLNSPDIQLQGAGIGVSLLLMDVRVESTCLLKDVEVVGSFVSADPSGCAIVNNVKFTTDPAGRIVGVWVDSENNLHVSTLGAPRNNQEAATVAFVSNLVAQALAVSGKKQAGKMADGGIYDYVDLNIAAVSNFAMLYTDTRFNDLLTAMLSSNTITMAYIETTVANATNGMREALGNEIVFTDIATLTGETFVVQGSSGAPPPPAPAGGERKNPGGFYMVCGEHVSSDSDGEIVYVDLHTQPNNLPQLPGSIIVSSASDMPVSSIYRQQLDQYWYRYTLAKPVTIQQGNWYEIRLPNNMFISLYLAASYSFAQPITQLGTDPGYDFEFRALIRPYFQVPFTSVRITPNGIELLNNAFLTMNGVPVATEAYVGSAIITFGQMLPGLYVEKNNNEQTMQGPLRITTTPADPQHALTMGHADGRYIGKAGGTMTGPLTLSGVAPGLDDAVKMSYVQTSAVMKTGAQSMQGPLAITAAITATNHVATKQYVDDSFKGFDYDARYVYIDKYYDGRNGYLGTLRAPFTNFFHALALLGSNSFYGSAQPVVYHVGHGYYKYPGYSDPGQPGMNLRIGIVGRGAFYKNFHPHLSGDSTVFSEIGTYVDTVRHAWYQGYNTNNSILYLKDLVVSGIYLYSSAHDDIYCDNVVFLSMTNNGQQVFHGLYYAGSLVGWGDTNAAIAYVDAASLRPGYWEAAQASNDLAYVRKAGDTMTGPLVIAADMTASNINVSTPDWHVGSAAAVGNIVVEHANGAISARRGNLQLGSVTGYVVAQKPLTFSAAAGARGIGATTGQSIPCGACSINAQVIITPTTMPLAGVRWCVLKSNGSFMVDTSSSTFTFDWVVIPASP